MTENELRAWMNTTENATSKKIQQALIDDTRTYRALPLQPSGQGHAGERIASAKSSFGSLQHARESLQRSLSCAHQSGRTMPKPHFTIWPEYGRSFLWINTKGTSETRGGARTDIADKLERGISKRLIDKLADWQLIYECNAYESTEHGGGRSFDWKNFHAAGIYLAVQLKEELGDRARVFYEKPMEDQNGHLNQRREVFADGQLGESE